MERKDLEASIMAVTIQLIYEITNLTAVAVNDCNDTMLVIHTETIKRMIGIIRYY